MLKQLVFLSLVAMAFCADGDTTVAAKPCHPKPKSAFFYLAKGAYQYILAAFVLNSGLACTAALDTGFFALGGAMLVYFLDTYDYASFFGIVGLLAIKFAGIVK